jgi:hypothetical protein
MREKRMGGLLYSGAKIFMSASGEMREYLRQFLRGDRATELGVSSLRVQQLHLESTDVGAGLSAGRPCLQHA